MDKYVKIFNCKCLDCGHQWVKSYEKQHEDSGVYCNNITCYSENTIMEFTKLYETNKHYIQMETEIDV